MPLEKVAKGVIFVNALVLKDMRSALKNASVKVAAIPMERSLRPLRLATNVKENLNYLVAKEGQG